MALALAFLVATALYAGFQWTIRMVVYPQFGDVAAADFVAYERRHQQRVTWAVGPLFLALGLTTLGLLVLRPTWAPGWAVVAAVALCAVILGSTALLAVPQHTRLSAGFDDLAYRRLLRVDTVRVLAAVADTALAAYLATRP